MRRRGRPKLSDDERRSEPVGVRLTKTIREQLETARHSPDGDRSLSQEIELRLRQSFAFENELRKYFRGIGTYEIQLFQLIAEAISEIQKKCFGDPPLENWFDDRFAFEQVTQMINLVLDQLKPRTQHKIPQRLRHPTLILDGQVTLNRDTLGREIALNILAAYEFRRDNPAIKPNFETQPREATMLEAAAPVLALRMKPGALREYWKNRKEIDRRLNRLNRLRRASLKGQPKGADK